MHMSSSYLAKSEYSRNYNKGSAITIKENGEDTILLNNGGRLLDEFGSFQRISDVDSGMMRYQNNSNREDNKPLRDTKDLVTVTFTSRIPISVCALPCNVGEKKVMSTVRKELIILFIKKEIYHILSFSFNV